METTVTISTGKVQVNLGQLWVQKSPAALGGGAWGSDRACTHPHCSGTGQPCLVGSTPQDPPEATPLLPGVFPLRMTSWVGKGCKLINVFAFVSCSHTLFKHPAPEVAAFEYQLKEEALCTALTSKKIK